MLRELLSTTKPCEILEVLPKAHLLRDGPNFCPAPKTPMLITQKMNLPRATLSVLIGHLYSLCLNYANLAVVYILEYYKNSSQQKPWELVATGEKIHANIWEHLVIETQIYTKCMKFIAALYVKIM